MNVPLPMFRKMFLDSVQDMKKPLLRAMKIDIGRLRKVPKQGERIHSPCYTKALEKWTADRIRCGAFWVEGRISGHAVIYSEPWKRKALCIKKRSNRRDAR